MVPLDLILALRLTLISLAPGVGLYAQSPPEDPPSRVVEPAVKIAFRLEGAPGMVRGTIELWDANGLQGSFGAHSWDELDLSSLRRVFQRLMDRRNAVDWVLFGELQLRRDDKAALRSAETAFLRAGNLGSDTENIVEAARARVKEHKRARAEADRQRATEQLREGLPEGVTWTAAPWPHLTDLEQAAAVATMREETEQLLERAGFPDARPIETEYFLIYSDLPDAETRELVRYLDRMYLDVAELLGLPGTAGKPLNLFWGKASIIICADQDQFRLIEAQAFNQMTPKGVLGLCHCMGPRVFVNTFLDPDDLKFSSVLVHETVHGIMHRFITPARLPTWAFEGFAEVVANATVRNSPVDKSRRTQGLHYIRNAGRIDEVMAMNYEDGTWPGENAVGYAVGYLLCDLMLDQNPQGFADWIKAVKAGKNWREAMAAHYGASAEKVAAYAANWYRTND
jgi:hypothetical protein